MNVRKLKEKLITTLIGGFIVGAWVANLKGQRILAKCLGDEFVLSDDLERPSERRLRQAAHHKEHHQGQQRAEYQKPRHSGDALGDPGRTGNSGDSHGAFGNPPFVEEKKPDNFSKGQGGNAEVISRQSKRRYGQQRTRHPG